MKVSRDFLIGLKLSPQPDYRIAQLAGVHPGTLSRLIHGASPLQGKYDPRIVAIGAVLGLEPHLCFEEEEQVQ